ncbi:MAG TPA: HNH endonuclease [Planctomycetes bacterium]|nr:HNH endonuclease [Planctomycetota bacterium]
MECCFPEGRTVSLLEMPTLVLNRGWTPIHTLPARLAIGLVTRDVASIIDPVTYEVHDLQSWHDISSVRDLAEEFSIRSSSLCLAPLEVIVLNTYAGVGDRNVTFSRLNLYRRDRNTCQYCGVRPGTKELTIDHILPGSRGGHLSWENCVLACVRCNKRKGNKIPPEAGMQLLRTPFQPDWTMIRRIPPRPIWSSWERFISDAYWQREMVD